MNGAATARAIRDPVLFQRALLQRRIWAKQQEIVRAVWNHSLVAVKGCHASGKCVEENEWLTLANGDRIQARDLIGQVFDLPTLAADGTVIPAQAIAAYNAYEPVWEMETESGRRIVRNARHPLWRATGVFPAGNRCKISPLGWSPISEFGVGDLVAVAEANPCFGSLVVDFRELKILGYLIGDGGFTGSTIVFTQQHGPQRREFEDCARSLGWVLLPTSEEISIRVRGAVKGANPCMHLLRRYGLMRKHSRDKRLPPALFRLSRECMAMFLSRLYATDGWASCGKHGVPQIGFASASEGLIRDIQEMLLKFGICARIEPKPKTHSWTLSIAASADVLQFCSAIGIYGKEDAVERVRLRAVQQQTKPQRRIWRWKSAPNGTRWERVASIRQLEGKSHTVAIEVPFHHTFLTSFWEHNTWAAAGLPLNWLMRYEDAKVFTTAPTLRQVKLMWEEIALARRGSVLTSQLPEPTVTGLRINEQRYAIGGSSSRGVNVQGFHAGHVLILADEAPGIEADIWDAIEGIRAGGNVHVLELGNPVVPSGHFYDAFGKHRSIYKTITISAFDCPNLQNEFTGEPLTLEELMELPEERLDYLPFPNLIRRRWVKERYQIWGPEHPKFRSRVLGEFPAESPYAVFPLAWIEKAKREPTEDEIRRAKGGVIQVGIDVAGAGADETCLYARVDGTIIRHQSWYDSDPRGAVVRILGELKHHPEYRLGPVVVDTIGIGYNFALHLADQGFDVWSFNAGSAPMNAQTYHNKKAEAHFNCREWFKRGLICNLDDEECEAQLSTIQYAESEMGKTVIESKDKMRERGLQSPDRAEALIMAFAVIIPARQRVDVTQRVRISPV